VKDGIESLILMDEALHPHVLVAFARALLKRQVSIVYRARCRFTEDLTPQACGLLYQSGCRYLGLGLEAASPRINTLVHKHTGPPIDHQQVLQHLEDAGIRPHVYAILAFPTETREEITATRDFLLENVRRFRYLTVSANIFHLMRGSAIARDPPSFGIEQILETGDVALVHRFVEKYRDGNVGFAEASAQQVYQAQFLPDLPEPATAEALWHFIDQTGMFYVQKVVHPINPFHAAAERRTSPLPPDFAERRYEPSFLFWLDHPSDHDHGVVCDWVTFNYVQVPSRLKELVFSFDSSVSLRSNAERLVPVDQIEEAIVAFRTFVQSGLFLPVAGNAFLRKSDGIFGGVRGQSGAMKNGEQAVEEGMPGALKSSRT